ncbi:hypothetical protein NTE09_003943 [Vibrio mimicus]
MRKTRSLSNIADCPACSGKLKGSLDALTLHYLEFHKRKPSEAEIFRFRSFKKMNPKNRYVVGYDSHPNEVSGGLPSLGKRR